MKISIEDYESRALDYLEGNLPADELPAFEAFLSEHPDLEREILTICNMRDSCRMIRDIRTL